MTRRHFERLAKILAKTRMPFDVRQTLAMEIARFAQEENPRFQPARFLQAVGVPLPGNVEDAARVSCEEFFKA